MITNNLCFGHLGNGISVWYSGSDKTIAHISINRDITYYKSVIGNADRKRIEKYAAEEDPAISYSQTEKVFASRPKKIIL